MSRSNIIDMGWANKDAFVVTFQTRDGIRSYQYDRSDGIQIMTGSDPHNFNAEEVSPITVFRDLAEDAEDLAEVLL